MSIFDKRKKERYNKFVGRRQGEEELVKEWNAKGRPPALLAKLLKSLDPLISREAKMRAKGLGGSIPMSAVKGELRKNTVRALELYDPTKGAKLQTHITNNFMRSTDFISTRRNTLYMPRTEVEKFQAFQNAKTEYRDETGRDPSIHELQKLLPKWTLKEIKRLDKGSGAEAFTGMGTGNLQHDNGMKGDEVRGAYLTMKSMMTEDERTLGEHLYPATGKRQKSVQEISRLMKIPLSKAYRIKKKVENKIKPLVRNQ